MKEGQPPASVVTQKPDQTQVAATGVVAVVCVIGILMEGYGLFFLLRPGSVTQGLLWIAGGLVMQVASGVHTRRRGGLVNPIRVLTEEVRAIRRRVGSWDPKQ
jgi:hypothetical protein